MPKEREKAKGVIKMGITNNNYDFPQGFFDGDEGRFHVDGDGEMLMIGFGDQRYKNADIYICCPSFSTEKSFVVMSFDGWETAEEFAASYADDEEEKLAGLIKRLAGSKENEK